MTTQTEPRISPLEPPYEPEVAETLRRMMPPGVEPLKLFRTVAHNHAVLERFRTTGAYILNFGTVEPARPRGAAPPHLRPLRMRVRVGRARGRLRPPARAVGRAAARHGAWRPPTTPPGRSASALLVRLADELHDTATVSERAVDASSAATGTPRS